MAFKPLKDQLYYLVAKHSGQALGVDNTQPGKLPPLVQMQFRADDKLQQFKFEAGSDFYRIISAGLPPELNLAVQNHSQDDHAPLVNTFSLFENDRTNSYFRLLPAGGGYYRIQVLHSHKYLDVKDAGIQDHAAVVQHRLMTSDNQLFIPIPVMNNPVGPCPVSFIKTNDDIRNGSVALIGKLPEVGEALGFIVGMFWTENDDLADLWNQMKVYVDKRIKELLDEAKLESIRNTLAGHLRNLEAIYSQTSKKPKGPDLDASLIALAVTEPSFLNNESAKVYPYLVSMGTIIILLKYSMLVNFDELYGRKPFENELTDKLKSLEKSVNEYVAVAERIRERLIVARLDQFKPNREAFFIKIVDNYTGWQTAVIESKDTKNISPSQFTYGQYRMQVEKQYATEVDEYLRPAKIWKYFKPQKSAVSNPNNDEVKRAFEAGYLEAYKEATTKKEVKITIGIFGGMNAKNKFVARASKKITQIIVEINPYLRVCGIEVFYDTQSSGLNGVKGTTRDDYILESDEYITSIYGYTREVIDGIWFQTQKGRTIGGGWANTIFFSADVADSFNPRLAGISGAYNNDVIEQLSFDWVYLD